ncbi:MAG: serine hydrolase domain-containing protein [Thiolinea sp.]
MQIKMKPPQLGFDTERLQRINRWMQRYIDEGKLAGSSVLLARHGEIVHLATAGQRSLAENQPFETDTIVRIYSMTKPVATVGIMQLVEKGLLHLDAPIDQYLPEFSACQALIPGAETAEQLERAPVPTVHQLLTHTAGFTYVFNSGVLGHLYQQHQIDFNPATGTLAQRTQDLAAMPLAFQPGSRWEYSVSIDVIGRIIEVVSGQPLDAFLAQEILLPLGMIDTGFSVSDSQLERYADCYVKTPDEALKLIDPAQNSAFHVAKVECFSAGGGLLSTLSDYFRFVEMLRRGGELDGVRILSPRTVAFMRRNHLAADIADMGPTSFSEMSTRGMGFGLGGSVLREPALTGMPGSVGDYSWGGMASTFFWTDPMEQLTVIFFTQLIPSSSYTCRAELKALVHGALVA